MEKKLTFLTQKINTKGGQERSSLEVLYRLAASGWDITIVSFELEDWPKEHPVKWRRVPVLPLPTQILKNLWFSFDRR